MKSFQNILTHINETTTFLVNQISTKYVPFYHVFYNKPQVRGEKIYQNTYFLPRVFKT